MQKANQQNYQIPDLNQVKPSFLLMKVSAVQQKTQNNGQVQIQHKNSFKKLFRS